MNPMLILKPVATGQLGSTLTAVVVSSKEQMPTFKDESFAQRQDFQSTPDHLSCQEKGHIKRYISARQKWYQRWGHNLHRCKNFIWPQDTFIGQAWFQWPISGLWGFYSTQRWVNQADCTGVSKAIPTVREGICIFLTFLSNPPFYFTYFFLNCAILVDQLL